MKIFKWIILSLVLIVLVAGIVIYVNLNSIVRRTIETQSTDSLNVQTTLGGASVSIFGGSLGLDDLQIASPQGFTAPRMLTLSDAKVNVSFGQLRSDPVHVDTIRLDQPKLVIEQSGGKLNFQALMDQQPKPTTSDNKPPMKLIIDRLTINNATAVLRPNIPGLANEITVPLPSIEVEKIGSGEGNQNGAAVKEVAMQVITVMASKAAESDKIPPEVRALLAGNLKEVASKLVNQQVQKVTEQLQKKIGGEAGAAVGEILKNPNAAATNPSGAVEKGLGGLLEQATQGKEKPAPTAAPSTPKKRKTPATQP